MQSGFELEGVDFFLPKFWNYATNPALLLYWSTYGCWLLECHSFLGSFDSWTIHVCVFYSSDWRGPEFSPPFSVLNAYRASFQSCKLPLHISGPNFISSPRLPPDLQAYTWNCLVCCLKVVCSDQVPNFSKECFLLGVVAHTQDLSTWVRARGSGVQGHSNLQSKQLQI